MASGSSYKNQQPNESLSKNAPSTVVPRRATRDISDLSSTVPTRIGRPETDGECEPRTRRTTPRTAEFETGIERSPRVAHGSASKKASAPPAPAFEHPLPPYIEETQPSHPLTRHRPWMPRLLLTVVCVVLGALVLAIAGIYVRQPETPPITYQGQSFPVQLGGSYQAFNTWNNSTGPIPTETPLPKHPGPYSVLGKPTISVDLINTVLASYHSPAAGLGKALYDLGVKYGIDPVYPLAFFMHESQFGTTGEARVTLSLGNSRCIPDRECVDKDRGGFAKMRSWQDGFEQWYKLIRNLYVAQWGRVTIDQIIPKYAPNADGNNEAAYIATIKYEIDVWRAGKIRP